MNIPEERIGQYLHEPFDLEHEFPVRWYVIEQASSKLLYLVSHHIALDGGSMSTLSSELFDILGTKYHAPDRPSESFSRAHLAEVGHVQHCYPDNSSPMMSSKHGDSRKHTRRLRRPVSPSSWVHTRSNGRRSLCMDPMTSAAYRLGRCFRKMFVS